jgi:hypothetical protein
VSALAPVLQKLVDSRAEPRWDLRPDPPENAERNREQQERNDHVGSLKDRENTGKYDGECA